MLKFRCKFKMVIKLHMRNGKVLKFAADSVDVGPESIRFRGLVIVWGDGRITGLERREVLAVTGRKRLVGWFYWG